MSINFAKIPDWQYEFNRGVLKAMAEMEEDGGERIIKFHDGYLPLYAYEHWQAAGSKGEPITSATEFGAELSRYVTTWVNINWTAAKNQLQGDPEETKRAEMMLRWMGNQTLIALGGTKAQETYEAWIAACENIPADITDPELYLAYTAELLKFARELWEDMHNDSRTLH